MTTVPSLPGRALSDVEVAALLEAERVDRVEPRVACGCGVKEFDVVIGERVVRLRLEGEEWRRVEEASAGRTTP